MIVKEKWLYSNCLIQALKQKIFHWRKVKVKVLWYKGKYWYHMHFYWQTDEYDYDFAPCKKWIGQPLFKGCIRRYKKGTFERLKQSLKEKNKKGNIS